MEQRELEPKNGRGPWLWVALGCGGFLLMGLCLVPAVAWVAFRGWADDRDREIMEAGPSRRDPAEPMPAPLPGPGLGPGMPAPPPMRAASPRHVTATVESASGLSSVAVGATCEFDVEQHDRGDGTFWCRAQVRCAGELLYGGPSAGYFDCTLYEQPHRHVVGEDRDTTRVDSDAAMRLNTLRNELEVRDDPSGRLGAFEVRARVTDVR